MSLKSRILRRGVAEPMLPPDVRVYAIGDLHGRADLLEQVVTRIEADGTRRPIDREIWIFLGDYVDRGPDTRAVLDRLILLTQSRSVVCLKGNHDRALLRFLESPDDADDLMSLGGLATAMSYGLRPTYSLNREQRASLSADLLDAMPALHRRFLERLAVSYQLGGYFFCHAGVRPGMPLTQQQERDLLWIREDFLDHEGNFGKIVVHGHTPVDVPDVRKNRINIDTGAFATGRLTCIALERNDKYFV